MTTLKAIEQAKKARRQTLAAYREKMYQKLTLAESKLEIWVRDATISDLMLLGSLPQSMLDAILKQAEGQKDANIDLNAFAGSADFGKLVNAIVMCCVVEPPVTEIGDDDHLGIVEIPADDRMQIFSWANREVTANAQKFRSKPKQPVSAALPG
jgi:hypothetical protein